VPQDPNDEPAKKLLERIRDAKANYPKNGGWLNFSRLPAAILA
jgi:hypothetical protein